jgi:hypothetical protein
MKVGSAAGVISGLSPGAEKAGEDLYTTYVPDETTDIIINLQEATVQQIACYSYKWHNVYCTYIILQ